MRIFRRRQPSGTSIATVNATVAELRDVVAGDVNRRWRVITDLLDSVQAQGDQAAAFHAELRNLQVEVAVMSRSLGLIISGGKKRNTERSPVTSARAAGNGRPMLYLLPPLAESGTQNNGEVLEPTGNGVANQAAAAAGGAA